MPKPLDSLPVDYFSVIYSFLHISDLNKIKRVSHFFEKTIEIFLEKSTPHKNTQEILKRLMFLAYLKHLKADFPRLKGKQPPALPYFNEKTLVTTPPKFSFFHGLFNFFSAYPIESGDFRDYSPPSQIDHLRRRTKCIASLLDDNLSVSPPNAAQLNTLSDALYAYRDRLVKILEKNEKISSRSPYLENINMRQNILAVCLGIILKFSSEDLFSKRGNCLGTLRALAFLSLIFKLLDTLFVSSCKAHLKQYYPGLRLSNQFLQKKLSLFEHFFDKAHTADEIKKALAQKIPEARAALSTIKPALEGGQPEKPMDLFFYYQHRHHPHAFRNKADENTARQNSIESIDKLYTHFCRQESLNKRSTPRL